MSDYYVRKDKAVKNESIYNNVFSKKFDELTFELITRESHLVDGENPHTTTVSEVGLGNIQNYPVASEVEGRDAVAADRYLDLQGAHAFVRTKMSPMSGVHVPTVLLPTEGTTLATRKPELSATGYSEFWGEARHSREFEIAAQGSSFSNIVWSGTANADSIIVDQDLEGDTDYEWRCRDIPEHGLPGGWSAAGRFTVPLIEITTPDLHTLSVSDVSLVDMEITTDPFASTIQDTHIATTWRLLRKEGTELILEWESVEDTVNLTSIILDHAPLEPDTDYVVRGIYHGEVIGASSAGELAFKTVNAYIEAPIVAIPASPDDPFNVSIAWNGTEPSGLDTHISSSLQIALDSDFTQIVFEINETQSQKTSVSVDSLADLTTYYARAKTHGNMLGNSDWSVVKEFTTGVFEGKGTEIVDPSGDIEVLDAAGYGNDAVLVGGSTQSPMQPVIMYRTPSDVIWTKRLTDLVTEGSLTSVVVSAGVIYGIGSSSDESSSFVFSMDTDGTMNWTQSISDGTVTKLTDIVVGDKVYISGYSDGYNGTGQSGVSGIVTAFDLAGVQAWTRVFGGTGTDRLNGIDYDNGSLVVVGSQSSDLGVTASGASVGVVCRFDINGNLVWSRSWDCGTSTIYFSVDVSSNYIRAVGFYDNRPLIGTFMLTNGNEYAHRRVSTSTGLFTKIVEGSASDFYLMGIIGGANTVTRINSSMTPSPSWQVKDNQVSNHVTGFKNDMGFELVAHVTRSGYKGAVLSRIPLNGVMGRLPYVLEYDWVNWSESFTSIPSTESRNYGEWSNYQTDTLSLTRNNNSSTAAPAVTQSDINSANSQAYGSTSNVRQVKDLRWANPEYYSHNNSYWATYGGTSSLNRSYSYQASESTLRNNVPTSNSTYRYTYSHYSYLGSTTSPNWGSWSNRNWNGGFVHASYSAALNHANGHKAAINQDTYDPAYEARSINVTVYQDAGSGAYEGRVSWQERRLQSTSTSHNYRIYYTTKKWTTSTATGYTWKLVYDYRTRGYVPVDIPSLIESLTPLVSTPILNDAVFEVRHSNF